MNRAEITSLINNIRYPYSDKYYEMSSADGFAFLGFARARCGLDYNFCKGEMEKRDYCLGAPWYGDEKTQYTYTIWTCIEFLREIKDRDSIKMLIDRVKDIGIYPDGTMRYCSVEINYSVPNMNGAAALMHCIGGEADIASGFVDLLRDRQDDGNWKYTKLDENFKAKETTVYEDALHLSMIIYQLREIERLYGIKTDDIVSKAICALSSGVYAGDGSGKIDWAYPMCYLASMGLDKAMERKFFEKTINESIVHDNFRTRAIAGFCLAKGLM